jgi:aminoglycoside 3-N-acetyltransferase
MHSRASLTSDFRRLGVAAGDVVMLHASVRAVGEVAGGPVQILLALQDAVGPTGSLLMYASCPQYYDEIGRGNLSAQQEQELRRTLPAFDPHTAPCARDNGALVEFFRTMPGTTVSAHVTRFAARGPHAEHLLADVPWDFTYGADSTLARFNSVGGKILLLGSDHDQVTFLHHAEHIVDVPDKIIATFEVPCDDGTGGVVWRQMKEFDTADMAHASWPADMFTQIVDGYLASTGNRGDKVGNAQSHLMDAPGLLAYAVSVMKTLAEAEAHTRRATAT